MRLAPFRKVRLASRYDSRIAAFKIAYGHAGNTIAIVDGDGEAALLNEDHANMFVAAPDMYEALKRAEITIAQHIRTGPNGDLHEMSAEEISAIVDAHPTIVLIRAALQKATPPEIQS